MKMEHLVDSFESITSFKGMLSAVVMCHDIYGHHKIGVCIPRLMPDTNWDHQATYYHDETIKKLKKDKIVNNDETKPKFKKWIALSNYLWVREMEWVRPRVHIGDDLRHQGSNHDHNQSSEHAVHTHDKETRFTFTRPMTKQDSTYLQGRNVETRSVDNSNNTSYFRPPAINEEILVMFMDGDPKFPVWLPFAPTFMP